MTHENELPVRVIVNPGAGRGRGESAAERVRAALSAAGIAFELELTKGPGHAIELARRAFEQGFRAVCAVGGDGAVSEVVNGLALATPAGEAIGPLIALGTGSGNDFAVTTGCPAGVSGLRRVIEEPRIRHLDLARATLRTEGGETVRYVDNSIGIGFEGRVNRESSRIRRLRGLPLYLLAALRALHDPGAPQLEIRWENEHGTRETTSGRFLMVTAGNGPRSGGGFYLTPEARHDNGTLELGWVTPLSRLRIVALLPKSLKGRHTSHPAVRIVRCRSFELTSREPLPIHADGEFLGDQFTKVEVTIEPGRLSLFT